MRKDKGARNEEQEGEEELRRLKDDGKNGSGAGAQGARTANAKVKNRRFPHSSDL
jgi:hypothetical protein